MPEETTSNSLPSVAEEASQQMMIKAAPEHCFEIVTDFERYPEWAEGIKEVEVLNRDEEGQPTRVRFKAEAMGRSTQYSLAYDYTLAPNELSWLLVEGDVEKRLDGRFVFSASDDQTEVTYHLIVELVVPIPGFLKRRIETRILNTLNELKARAEA